jgi:hypothetical protein
VTTLAFALFVVEMAWVGAGFFYAWPYPMLGWVVPVAMAVLGAYACSRVPRRADLSVTTRRFWGMLMIASGMLVSL